MKKINSKHAMVAALAAAALALTASASLAQYGDETTGNGYSEGKLEASLLGGVQGLMKNDTALPDDFVNIPVAASLAYHVTSIFALEGELAWLIPVQNSVSLETGGSADLKSPDILSYQANLRANLPVGPALSPYVTAGAGAMTFLSATDADNYPQLESSETTFAINFGLGTTVPLTTSLSVRADFREFVAFPRDDTVGLSDGTSADPIWMPRGTFGLAYRF